MVQTPARIATLTKFLTLPESKLANEFINQILQKLMLQGQHSTLQGDLMTQLNQVVKPNKQACAFPELRCTFGGRSTVPYVAVFTWERIPRLPDGNIANQSTKPAAEIPRRRRSVFSCPSFCRWAKPDCAIAFRLVEGIAISQRLQASLLS